MHPKIVYTTVLPIWIYNLSGNITTNPDIRWSRCEQNNLDKIQGMMIQIIGNYSDLDVVIQIRTN
jgi:hypothetical protein